MGKRTRKAGYQPALGANRCEIAGLSVLFLLFCLTATSSTSLLAQPVLTVSSLTTNFTVTAAQFAALPHTNLTVTDPHEQKEHQYSAVPVSDLLAQAGAPLGDKLRGSALHYVVTVRARDGYAVAFTLADFDGNYGNRNIVLADHEDGYPLSDAAGPLRLIVPSDKKGARWVRMVTKIEILDSERK
jgi:hypothetical protein